MYNERTRQPFSAAHRSTPCSGTAVKRDIPVLDLDGGMQSRRRCDGTPRNSGEDQMTPSDCSMGKCGGWGLQNKPLAMVYSPCQAWRDAYAPDVALSRGTLFSELDLPFEPAKNRKGCM